MVVLNSIHEKHFVVLYVFIYKDKYSYLFIETSVFIHVCLIFVAGSFEESVLNGRLEPVSTVQGFTADLGASGSFCPRHLILPVTVFFYTLGDNDKVSTPYLVSSINMHLLFSCCILNLSFHLS